MARETLNETLARYQAMLPFFSLAQTYPDYPKGGLIPPALTDPNYVPPSRKAELNAVVAVMLGLATLVVVLRLLMTWRMPGLRMGLEDWAIVPAIILLIVYAALIFTITTQSCVGLHAYDCNVDEIRMGWSLNVPLVLVYIFQVYFAKLSNLFFVRRITPPELTWTRNIITGFFVFHTLWTLLSALVDSFLCSPVKANFNLDARINGAKCLNQWAYTLAINVLFVLSDFGFLLLPMGVLRRMKLPRRTKVGIILLFCLGLVTCAACIAKLRYFDVYYKSWDVTWGVVDEVKWSFVEASLLVITVSLPTMDPLLVKLIPTRLREKLRQRDERHELEKHAHELSSDHVEKRVVSMDKMRFAAALDPRMRPDRSLTPAMYQTDVSSARDDRKSHFSSDISQDEDTTVSGISASNTFIQSARSQLSPEPNTRSGGRGSSWFDFD